MFVIAFHGENFIPEFKDDFDDKYGKFGLKYLEYKYNMDKCDFDGVECRNKFVHSGRFVHYDGKGEDYSDDAHDITPSRHFTFLFNAFVMMQFFNFLNARKLNDEFNIFKNFFSNTLFFAIVILILFLQVIFVTFGGRAFDVYLFNGLTVEHWFMCIAFGCGGLIVSVLVKFIKEDKLNIPQLGIQSSNPFKSHSILEKKPSMKRYASNVDPSSQKLSFRHKNVSISKDEKKKQTQQGPI